MSDDISEVFDLLGGVNDLLEATPEGAAIFRDLRAGEITADEAVAQLAKVAQAEGMLDTLKDASEQVNALIPGGPLSPELIEAASRPVTMKTSTGINQLNPLYEASIAERVAIDGDAPELRTGPFPEDEQARPAVPVVTTSRDPVAIGLMLERASNEISHQLRLETQQHRDLCQGLLEAAGEAASEEGRDVTTALELVEKNLPPVPTGVAGYVAGQVPALRVVEPPSPHVVAVLDVRARRVACYKTLTTTQGKVSTVPVIEKAVRDFLESKRVPLALGSPEEDGPNYVWAAQVFGPEDISDNFNPIQAAISHFEAKCLIDARSRTRVDGTFIHPEGGWALSVIPYNDIAQRRFGWAVRFGKEAGS